HAPGARVVDDDGTGRGEARGVLLRGRPTGREERDVDPGEVLRVDVLDDDRVAAPLERGAGRPRRREEAQLPDRVRALLEDIASRTIPLSDCPHDCGGESRVGDSGLDGSSDRSRGWSILPMRWYDRIRATPDDALAPQTGRIRSRGAGARRAG